ncbi:MAG: type II toxin-antitoxin system RelE/ParE family toxin [Verrucomicrobia bacterium]|nr:type II toxin-antitoxin system RelE/ParE family toxin [Verrucomicrobiota bacterium]MCH8510061.1 type II toxin-antitoxin system RelE/ParE family toxin [Kiritimatiellia bacterium]
MSLDREILASPLFGRKAKKLQKVEKRQLDEEVKRILENPEIGQEKKGDLQGVRVHKYKMNNQQMLLAYQVFENEILLLTFGSHENYYRDLKKYIK